MSFSMRRAGIVIGLVVAPIGGTRLHEVSGQFPQRKARLATAVATLLEAQHSGTPIDYSPFYTLISNTKTVIQQAHADTQKHLDDSIANLENKTNLALDKKTHADTMHSEYFECVRDERNLRLTYEQLYGEEAELTTQYNNAEQARIDAKDIDKTWSQEVFTCNALVSDCSQASDSVGTANKIAAGQFVQSTIEPEVNDYNSKAQAATILAGDVSSKTAEKETGFSTYEEKRDGCNTFRFHDRDQSRCTFADKLYEKCEAVTEYETLVSQAIGTSNVYSHLDRVAEWSAIEHIECLLEKLDAGDLNNVSCAEGINYEHFNTSVGTLFVHTQTLEALVQPEKFTCDETAFSFGGKDWIVPEEEDELWSFQTLSDDYTELSNVEYAADHSTTFIFDSCAGLGNTVGDLIDCSSWCSESTADAVDELADSVEDVIDTIGASLSSWGWR